MTKARWNGVEFGEDVIEKGNRRVAGLFGHHDHFRQFEGEDGEALLTARAVGGNFDAAVKNRHVVPMRPDD